MKYLFAIILFFFLYSCHKKNPINCGCDSPVIQNIDSYNGTLSYNKTQSQYSIYTGSPGLVTQYVICDSNFTQLKSIIDTNKNINYPVTFSGDIKDYCKSDNLIYLNFMFNIHLITVKKQ